eukprot:295926_1
MQQQDLISLLRKKELLHRLTDLVQIGVKTLFDLNSYRPLPEVLVASTSLTQSDVNKLFDINQFNSPTCAINQIQRHTLNEVQSPIRKTNNVSVCCLNVFKLSPCISHLKSVDNNLKKLNEKNAIKLNTTTLHQTEALSSPQESKAPKPKRRKLDPNEPIKRKLKKIKPHNKCSLYETLSEWKKTLQSNELPKYKAPAEYFKTTTKTQQKKKD